MRSPTMRRRSRLFLAVLGALAPGGCSKETARPGPNRVAIIATEYAFQAPDTIPAGLTTFRLINHGQEIHHAMLMRIGEGKTLADLQQGLQAMMTNMAAPP